MAQPYVGEIRMFGGNFAPLGWLFCDGSIIPISENETLFQLIGTTYGGDGQNTFGLPDLRGRLPVHAGSGFTLGENGGVEEVTLTTATIPIHSHGMLASTAIPAGSSPKGSVTGQAAAKLYRAGSPTVTLNPQSLLQAGGNQPHSNMQPYLCVNFIISQYGIFPSQS
jgi:microcystin-dependent protein